MLRIDNLRVNYGGIEAVKDISFTVPEGKIVTLIGANGAGKSTTLRAIAGLVKPATGRIRLQAEDLTVKLYPGGRHEMMNEINRDEVFEDVLTWLDAHTTEKE